MAGSDRSKADGTLIAALAVGATVEAAAKHSGVSESTIYRRLKDAGFCQQVNAARADLVERAVARLSAASVKAVKTLDGLLDAPTPPAVRLGAARSVLELGQKMRESGELEARLAAIEEALKGRQ